MSMGVSYPYLNLGLLLTLVVTSVIPNVEMGAIPTAETGKEIGVKPNKLECKTELAESGPQPAEKLGLGSFSVSHNPDDVKFYLYKNSEDEDERQEIFLNNVESVFDSGFIRQNPLILLTHGVLSSTLTISDVQQVKNAFLRTNTSANLVMVDYGALTESTLPFVLSPLSFVPLLLGHANTHIVSDRVTEFIVFLIQTTYVRSPEDIHLIGFSLGAHIFGNVGKEILKKLGKPIKRVTGLDPSPQYPGYPTIEPTDAEFVDVTLTSLGFISTIQREGMVQFYINGGGPHQPSCPNFAPVTETYCSHTTAVFYFAKSIKRKNIIACHCPSQCNVPPSSCLSNVTYGEHVPTTARGNFYVTLT